MYPFEKPQELYLIRQWHQKLFHGMIKTVQAELSIYVPTDADIIIKENSYGFDRTIIETERNGIKITYSFLRQAEKNRNVFGWSAIDLSGQKFMWGGSLDFILLDNGIYLYHQDPDITIIYDDWKLISMSELIGVPPDLEVIFNEIASHSDFFNNFMGITDKVKNLIRIKTC